MLIHLNAQLAQNVAAQLMLYATHDVSAAGSVPFFRRLVLIMHILILVAIAGTKARPSSALCSHPPHPALSALSHSQRAQSASALLCSGGDRLCGLVVRVLGYRSGGPGSIPGTTRKKSGGTR
jgi:hypothetical protein